MLDIDVRHLLHALPYEAVEMSRSGVAYGYDVLRFGEKWERETGGISPVIKATPAGVERLFTSDAEREWLYEPETSSRRAARRRALESVQWSAWREVSPCNRDFLLSLIWIPEDMYSPLEVLARMGE